MMTTVNDLNVTDLTDKQLYAALGLLATSASKPLSIPALDLITAKIEELHAEVARRDLKATHIEFGPDEASLQAIIRSSKKAKPVKPMATPEPPKPAIRGSHANCSHPATKAARRACRKVLR